MVYRIIEKNEYGWLLGILFYYIPIFPFIIYLIDQAAPGLFR
jgi:hypothetical protein